MCGVSRPSTAKWLHASKEISLPGVRVRTFQIPHAFPIVAVVGILHPRLFVAEQVLLTLTPEELAATVAHEYGHLQARDNLKRGLLRACRDALLIPVGDAVEKSWSAAAESAADEYAAEISADVALNLASALVKIARMVPVGARAQMPLAAAAKSPGCAVPSNGSIISLSAWSRNSSHGPSFLSRRKHE